VALNREDNRMPAMKIVPRAAAVCSLMLCLAGQAAAHHSAAMFDDRQRVSLTGTVREFQWTNPHCYIQLLVANDQGQEQEWSVEKRGPHHLYNLGWRPNTLKPGDRSRVVAAPMRKGGTGGMVIGASTADGRRLGKPVRKTP